MNKEAVKRESLILLVLLAPIIFLLAVWNKLPAELPVHWNIKGEVDDYGPKYLPALVAIGIYLLMALLPKIDPRKKNYAVFSDTYFKLRLVITLFLGVIHSVIIANAVGVEMEVGRIIIIAALLLLTIMGNYLGTLRPNWFVGIRLPWTMENATVWKKTHQLAAKLWFWLGLIALILAIFLPIKIMSPITFSVVAVMVLVPIIYSYIIFKKEQKAELE